MSTGYNIIGDLQYENMLLRARNEELEEENKKLRDYVDNLDSENDNQAIEIEELKKEKSELEQIKEWKRSLLLEGKMIQDIDAWNSLVGERNDLLEENKKLKEELETATKCSSQEEGKLRNLEKENKKLRETIKDHQLYEEKLEHRIIEFEELLHGE